MNIRHSRVLVCYFSTLFATTSCESTTQFEFRCCCFRCRRRRSFFPLSGIIAFISNEMDANVYMHVQTHMDFVYVCRRESKKKLTKRKNNSRTEMRRKKVARLSNYLNVNNNVIKRTLIAIFFFIVNFCFRKVFRVHILVCVCTIHINIKREKRKKYCQAAIVIQSKSNAHTQRQTHEQRTPIHMHRNTLRFVGLVFELLCSTGFMWPHSCCVFFLLLFSLHFTLFMCDWLRMSYIFSCVLLRYLLFYFRLDFTHTLYSSIIMIVVSILYVIHIV